ncbi:hypothetical protein EJB05_15105, partial [Eragrostis curvula]
MFTAAALNSFNAAASATAGDKATAAEEYHLLVALLEEGWRPAFTISTGRREASRQGGHPCSPGWKITIRASTSAFYILVVYRWSFVAVATLLAAAFMVSLISSCASWSEAGPLLASLVMLPMIGGFVWALTLDYFGDPHYNHNRTRRSGLYERRTVSEG